MSILVVDDTASQRLLLRSILKAEGYSDVTLTDSARAAFSHLAAVGGEVCSVDLVLLDVSMPEMDGIAACRQLKADARLRDIPVVMVTASAEAEDLQLAFDAGATDYITKPPNRVELVARVRSALRLKQETDRRKARERELLEMSNKLAGLNEVLEARIEEQMARLRLAAKIQWDLLPKEPPLVPGYQVAGRTIPAQLVGGDYFDFISVDDRRLALCVADVSGKGLPASLLMANLQATIRGQTLWNPSARECMRRSNRLLFQSTDIEKFATVFYGILDIEAHELRYSNAGHNPPLLFRAGEAPRRLETGGLVLGILEDSGFEEEVVPLGPGDVLVLYSDGITEALDARQEEFGEEALIRVVEAHRDETAAAIVDAVGSAVERFAGSTPQSDDMTLMVLRR